MYDYCPAFNDHLFAISSVSGGSLGAAAYVAALKAMGDKPTSSDPTQKSTLPQVNPASDPCPAITQYLSGEKPVIPSNLELPGPLEIHMRKVFASDFLSPVVGRAMFTDYTQSFLPFPIDAFDRARALEFAFEQSDAALNPNHDSYLAKDFTQMWAANGKTPALLINTTDAGSGRRILISPFVLTGTDDIDINSIIPYQTLGKAADPKDTQQHPPAIRLSTAAGMSPRFSWVTPAATVPVRDVRLGSKAKIRLVDGGYVENSGVETALNLIDMIQDTVDRINDDAENSRTIGKTNQRYRKIHLRLIVLTGGDYPVRTSFSFGEEAEPVRALLNTRSSRAYVAINEAARRYPPHDLPGLATPPATVVKLSDLSRSTLNSRLYPLPLGWAMSNRTRQIIEKQSGYYWECYPDKEFNQSQRTLAEADCIQLVVYHELNQSLLTAAKEIAAASQAPDSHSASRLNIPSAAQ